MNGYQNKKLQIKYKKAIFSLKEGESLAVKFTVKINLVFRNLAPFLAEKILTLLFIIHRF